MKRNKNTRQSEAKKGKEDHSSEEEEELILDWSEQTLTLLGLRTGVEIEPHGGFIDKKFFILKEGTKARTAQVLGDMLKAHFDAKEAGQDPPRQEPKGKIKKVLAGDPQRISDRKDFSGERVRQVLRWTSTALLDVFYDDGPIEVQCYYTGDKVVISANSIEAMTAMSTAFGLDEGGTTKNIVQHIIDNAPSFTDAESTGKLKHIVARSKRHIAKLAAGLEEARYEAQEGVMECLRTGDVVFANVGPDGLHAERRILALLQDKWGQALDPEKLGGVRRPCAICHYALELAGKTAPGPLWISPASTQGVAPQDFLDWLEDKLNHDCADDCGCKLFTEFTGEGEDEVAHFDYDENSDSEIEIPAFLIDDGEEEDESEEELPPKRSAKRDTLAKKDSRPKRGKSSKH